MMSGQRRRRLRSAAGIGLAILFILGFFALTQVGEAAPEIDFILIMDAPNGTGSVVGNRTYITGQTETYYAAGFNNTTGYVEDVEAYWYSDDWYVIEVTIQFGNSTTAQAKEYGVTKVHADAWRDPTGGNKSDGLFASTGNLTVISDVDTIVLSDQPEGGGLWFGDYLALNETPFSVFAAGYNSTSGYLRDVPVHWSSTNDSLCGVWTWRSSFVDVNPYGRGSCRITGNYSPGVSNTTGQITVTSDIDYVVVRDSSNDEGAPVGNVTYIIDQEDHYWAAGYNNTSGYRRDVRVYWSSTNDSVCMVTSFRTEQTTLRFLNDGYCHVTINYAWYAWNSTGNITVLFDIDNLVIRDAIAGGGQPVGDRTLLVGLYYNFYAAGYNETDGFRRDLDVDWINSNTTVCTPRYLSGKGYRIEAWFPGVCRLTASYRSRITNETGNQTVLFDIDEIVIRDAAGEGGDPVGDRTYFTGQSEKYYAAGYNNTTGYRRDLQSVWSSNNTPVCTVSSTDTVNFWAEGICKISANFRDLIENSTGNLTVMWDVDYLVVEDAPGVGGAPVGDRTYYLDDEDYFYAVGYNTSTGYLRDLKPSWMNSNSTVCSIGSIGNGGVHFRAISVGLCKISATYLGRISNSTGNLTVRSDIDSIIVRDGQGGSGDWVDDGDYIHTTEHEFYAAGYNSSSGYKRDVPVIWTTNNSASCGLNSHQTHVTFTAKALGYCQVNASYHGVLFNSTGLLHVIPRPVIVVDDDGTGDYLTIGEALENAVDGTIIRVLNGTYFENVVVDKSVTIEGLDKSDTWVNGSGSGTVFLVEADNVRITGLTIESAEYGIFLDSVEDADIDYNTVRWYEYGIYSKTSKNSHIERNLITEGSNGIVTYYSHNDAVWFNEISYNTVYGVKDYNSKLSKCFNWNYFHHNTVAYYYDPEVDLDPLILDGNLFEDNEVAILVEYSSSIHVTNNTVRRGEKGISILDGSPFVGNNTIIDVSHGIELTNSSSHIVGNVIENTPIGIIASRASPIIEGNTIRGPSEIAIRIEDVMDASVISNDLGSGQAVVSNSSLALLQASSGILQMINSYWVDIDISNGAIVEVKWWVQLQVLSRDGNPISGASLKIFDRHENLIAEMLTDQEGLTSLIALTERRLTENEILDLNPYLVSVEVEGISQQYALVVESNNLFSLSFQPVVKDQGWLLWILLALFLVAPSIALPFSFERVQYLFLSLFFIFYVKLEKEDILGQFTRGRIYGYIEANPGIHFGAIRRALSISSGNAVYHLKVLEREGMIVAKNYGRYKRFYQKNVTLPPDNGAPLSELSQRIISCIDQAPSITQKEIANLLGIHQSTLKYQLQKLTEADLIRRKKIGRKVRYYAVKQSEDQ